MRLLTAAVLASLLSCSAQAQEADALPPLSDDASVVAIDPGATLYLTMWLSYDTEAGIRYAASDSVRVQLITHPKSDLVVTDGNLQITCQGLHSHEVRASEPVTLPDGQIGSRTRDGMALLTAVFHNPSSSTVELQYEPGGNTRRMQIVSADLEE